MKKILISIMIIAVVAAVAAGGTVAYFNQSNTMPASFSSADFNVYADNYGTDLVFNDLIPGGEPVVHWARVINDGDMDAYIRASTSYTWGSSALYDALWVKVTLLGSDVISGGGNYPYPGINTVSYDGLLKNLAFDNVVADNPIQPGQTGVYKIEVTLPFGTTADNSMQNQSCGCNVLFEATQSDGQSSPILW